MTSRAWVCANVSICLILRPKSTGVKMKKRCHSCRCTHIFCDILVSRNHGLTKGILYGKQTQGNRSVSEEIPVKRFTAEPDGESYTCTLTTAIHNEFYSGSLIN